MAQPDSDQKPRSVSPASADMAAKLAVNRTGRLTPEQRRVVLIAGLLAAAAMLCPLAMLVQIGLILTSRIMDVVSVCGGVILGFGLFFMIIVGLMIGSNILAFLPEAFAHQAVRAARGPLEIHYSERERPELPFSYVIGAYSFAPYVAPTDVEMRTGAPYVVYYGARSRLLLSIAALDAPDANQWEPDFPVI